MAELKRTMGCGCIVALDYDNTLTIRYCPTHKAAPDMYEALENLVERIDAGLALGEKLDVIPARDALLKAEGGLNWVK